MMDISNSKNLDFKYDLHFTLYNNFVRDQIVSETLAYYIFSGYSLKTLEDISLIRHCNSAYSSIFNGDLEINKDILDAVKKILSTKYKLKVENEKRLKLREM